MICSAQYTCIDLICYVCSSFLTILDILHSTHSYLLDPPKSANSTLLALIRTSRSALLC